MEGGGGGDRSIVEPQLNEPLFNKNLDTMNSILCPSDSKYTKKNLDIMNPQFNERLWPVPSDFVFDFGWSPVTSTLTVLYIINNI